MLKKKLQENRKKNDNDVIANVAQLEYSNNKYYASVFKYSQILCLSFYLIFNSSQPREKLI